MEGFLLGFLLHQPLVYYLTKVTIHGLHNHYKDQF